MKDWKKIIILGGPGSGKSVLAYNLGEELNIKSYYLDAMHYKYADKDERNEQILDILKTDSWVIDGTYTSTLAERMKQADVIIYLDYSTFAHLKGVICRSIKNNGKEKKEIPGLKEKLEFDVLKITYNWNRNRRKIIYEMLEKNNNKEIFIFKNRNKLNKWYKENFNRKIRRF